MRYYDQRLASLNRDFKSILIDDTSINEHIRVLLINLGIPKSQWDKYFGNELTVYDFFLALSQAGHLQMSYIVRVIDRKEKISRLAIVTGIALPAGIAACILSTPPMADVWASMRAFLASTESLPILGIVKTTLFSTYNLYQIFSDKKQPLFNRLRDASFVIAKAAINYVGYSLWIASIVSMTPIVASLFVISSLLDLGKEIFCLVQHAVQYSKTAVGPEEDMLNTRRNQIRHKIGTQSHLNAAIINLVTAVVLVGVFAAWTFAPGGIIVVAASIAALILVYTIQYFVLRHNKREMREKLQKELSLVEDEYRKENPLEFELSDIEPSDINKTVSSNLECEASADKPPLSPRQATKPSVGRLSFFAPQNVIADDINEGLSAGNGAVISSR